jgi:hypothetical protein
MKYMMIGILKNSMAPYSSPITLLYAAFVVRQFLCRIHRSSCFFAAYSSSVTLLHAQQICVITKA